MQNWFPASTAYVTHRSGVIVAAMLVFGPLSLFKSMRRFAPLSMIGVWAIFGLALCIIARFALTYTHAVDAWPVPVPPAHAWRFYQPNFFPAIGASSGYLLLLLLYFYLFLFCACTVCRGRQTAVHKHVEAENIRGDNI